MKSAKRNVLALFVSATLMCSASAHANWEPYLSVFAAIRDATQDVHLKERLEELSAFEPLIVEPGAFLFKAAQLGNLAATATILNHFADLLSEKDIEAACRIAMRNQHYAVFAKLLETKRLSQATLTALMVRAMEDDRIKAAKLCLVAGAQMNQIVRCQAGRILEGQRYPTISGEALVKRLHLEYVFSQLPANSDEVLAEENSDLVSETLKAQEDRNVPLLTARLLDFNWQSLNTRRLNFDTYWVSTHLFIRALSHNDNEIIALLNSLKHLKAHESFANLALGDDTRRGLLNQLSRAVQIGDLEKVQASVNSLGVATLDQPTKNAMVMLAAHQHHNNIVLFLLHNLTLEPSEELSRLAADLNYSGLELVKPRGCLWTIEFLKNGEGLSRALRQIELFGNQENGFITSVVGANDWEIFLQLSLSEEELSAGAVAAICHNRVKMFSICLDKKERLSLGEARLLLSNILVNDAIECMRELMALYPALNTFPGLDTMHRSKEMKALLSAYKARTAVNDSSLRRRALRDAVDSGEAKLVEETLNHSEFNFEPRQLLFALVRAGLERREKMFSTVLDAFLNRLTPDERVRLRQPLVVGHDLPMHALNVLFAFAGTLQATDNWVIKQAARKFNSFAVIDRIIKMVTFGPLPREIGEALHSAAKHNQDETFKSLLRLVKSVEPSSFYEVLKELDTLDLKWTQLVLEEYGNAEFPSRFLKSFLKRHLQHVLRHVVTNAIGLDQLSYPEDALNAAIILGDAELMEQFLSRHPLSISTWPPTVGYDGVHNMALVGAILARVQPKDRAALLACFASMEATDAVWQFIERFPQIGQDQIAQRETESYPMINLLRAYRAIAPAPTRTPVLRLSGLL